MQSMPYISVAPLFNPDGRRTPALSSVPLPVLIWVPAGGNGTFVLNTVLM
ncbi:hypothetical protein PAMC26510_16520 [Caballeronia sordidicola]|uniref:Uncharacterized protein n=1 Tax=Caballeronia sordidicola TaxID=196367 RepID=A0A242MST1_CABSO|nr:hypothetical protein PAMC26510_16520 [Caballeronia sordidicola]